MRLCIFWFCKKYYPHALAQHDLKNKTNFKFNKEKNPWNIHFQFFLQFLKLKVVFSTSNFKKWIDQIILKLFCPQKYVHKFNNFCSKKARKSLFLTNCYVLTKIMQIINSWKMIIFQHLQTKNYWPYEEIFCSQKVLKLSEKIILWSLKLKYQLLASENGKN